MSESHRRDGNLLGALGLAVADRLHEAAGPDSRSAALVTLANYPGQSIETLRGTLEITHSGAVKLVDRLEADGLARRSPSGAGRMLSVTLTARGRRAADAVLDRRHAAMEQVLESLPRGEREAFVRAAEQMLAGLTTDRGSAHQICRLCDEVCCVQGAECPVDVAAGK